MCQSSEEWFTTRGLAVNWCFTRLEKNSTEKDEGVGVDNSFTGQWRYCVAQTEHTLAHLASAHASAGSELLYCGGRGRVCCCVRARHKHRHRELGESRDGDGITLLCSLSLDSRMMTMCPGPGQETRVNRRRHGKSMSLLKRYCVNRIKLMETRRWDCVHLSRRHENCSTVTWSCATDGPLGSGSGQTLSQGQNGDKKYEL